MNFPHILKKRDDLKYLYKKRFTMSGKRFCTLIRANMAYTDYL